MFKKRLLKPTPIPQQEPFDIAKFRQSMSSNKNQQQQPAEKPLGIESQEEKEVE
jgi:hypothetical protein